MGPPVRYLSTLRFSDAWLDALRAAAPGVEVRQMPAAHPGDIPGELWHRTDVLHTHNVLPDPGVAPRLRWVQLDTSGVDHVVGHPVWDAPVDITTIGGISPVPMAEYVMMMILAFSHHLPSLRAAQHSHEWPPPIERWQRFMPRRLPGATVGIVGYGRIGREIGRLARAFGMEVIGVRRAAAAGLTGGESSGAERTGAEVNGAEVNAVGPGDIDGVEVATVDQLDQVIPRCDYLVVTVPLTAHTTGLLGADALRRLRPGAVLVDVARGGVVEEAAVLDALEDGRLAGVALDVFATEPLPPDSPLWDHPSVIVTPHVAGFAPAYESAVLDLVADNLRRFVEGRPLTNRVDRVRGY